MKRRHVQFTATARRHVQKAKVWWLENSLRPEILADEMAEALTLLSVLPGAGTAYPAARKAGLRRLYLRRLSAHLYYTFDDEAVVVRALWHASRGRGPRW